jgi:hypothetical protein
MRRFSVRSLMVFIFGAAVGLAALRNANVYWAAGMSVAVLAALATSVVGIISLRGKEQCAWAGFAVFSSMYLGCTAWSEFSDGFRDSFGPTVALNYIQSQAEELGTVRRDLLRMAGASVKLERAQQEIEKDLGIADPVQAKSKLDNAVLDYKRRELALRESAARWHSWLPGAANANAFLCVGHSLFALLSGLIGTVVGRIFCARRTRSETQTT